MLSCQAGIHFVQKYTGCLHSELLNDPFMVKSFSTKSLLYNKEVLFIKVMVW